MVTAVDFHPQGTLVASAANDGAIKVFDIRTHKLLQHYGAAHALETARLDGATPQSGVAGCVNSLRFGGAAGEWLLSTGSDSLVKVWDVAEGHLMYTLHGHNNKHTLNTKSVPARPVSANQKGATTSAVWSPSGDFFATAGTDSQVMVWKSNFDSPDGHEPRAITARSKMSDISTGGGLGRSSQEPRYRPLKRSPSPAKQTIQTVQANERSQAGSPFSRVIYQQPASPGLIARPEIVQVGSSLNDPVFEHGHADAQNYASYPEEEDEDWPRHANYASPKHEQQLHQQGMSEQIHTTLQHLVKQMDVLTQTMSILEVILCLFRAD